jgi:cytochrome P450
VSAAGLPPFGPTTIAKSKPGFDVIIAELLHAPPLSFWPLERGFNLEYRMDNGNLGSTEKSPELRFPEHVPAEVVYDYDFANDPRLIADPYERMKSLHREAPPLFFTPRYGGHWVITSRKLLQEVAYNHADFSAANLMLPPAAEVPVLIPATFDPPQHDIYRMPLNRHFFPKAVAAHEPFIRVTAIGLIEALAGQECCDFLHEVAEPFPPTVFFRILGVPLGRLREFRDLANTFMCATDAGARSRAYAEIGEIVSVTVAERMAVPRDDLISILAASDFDGRKLSREELVNYAIVLFIGGLDTVVNAACFMVRFLALDQALQSALRADPAQIPKAVEELLRMHSIATPMRTATRDMAFHGAQIRKGDQFLLLLAAINYDPEQFASADQFCPHRAERHVVFNVGVHRCIGVNLATLELRVLLEEWLKRIPHFRLDPAKPPEFGGGFSIAARSLALVLG